MWIIADLIVLGELCWGGILSLVALSWSMTGLEHFDSINVNTINFNGGNSQKEKERTSASFQKLYTSKPFRHRSDKFSKTAGEVVWQKRGLANNNSVIAQSH